MKSDELRVEVIEPHGFCSGVKGAVEKARRALSAGRPVWCLHELVHNGAVVDELRKRGMRFVESLEEVPEGENPKSDGRVPVTELNDEIRSMLARLSLVTQSQPSYTWSITTEGISLLASRITLAESKSAWITMTPSRFLRRAWS